MYSILIADDNRQWLDLLEAGLNMEKEFNVVAKALDGREALIYIDKLRPDIIILDMVMPEFDGVYIVNYIKKNFEEYDPVIYILSGLRTQNIERIINNLKIDFYAIKPATLDSVVQSLKNLMESKVQPETKTDPGAAKKDLNNSCTDKELVRNFIYKLGMPPHLTSTACVVDALTSYINMPDCFRMLTKVLYPHLAKKRGVSIASIEKNIRDAVAKMQIRNTPFYREVFVHFEKRRITNGVFLSVAARYIEREKQ